MLLTVPLRNAVAMTRCINDSGRSIYTNIECPKGYLEYGEKKVISEDTVDIILPVEANVSPTPCDSISGGQTGTYEGVTLLVEKIECFNDPSLGQLKEEHLFWGLLVTIQNNGTYKLYTGGNFDIVTKDGYEISSQGVYGSEWSQNRMVWNSQYVDVGTTRKGWVVFGVPQKHKISQLLFTIYKYDTSRNVSEMGELNVTL